MYAKVRPIVNFYVKIRFSWNVELNKNSNHLILEYSWKKLNYRIIWYWSFDNDLQYFYNNVSCDGIRVMNIFIKISNHVEYWIVSHSSNHLKMKNFARNLDSFNTSFVIKNGWIYWTKILIFMKKLDSSKVISKSLFCKTIIEILEN